jgi:hypothetical protein
VDARTEGQLAKPVRQGGVSHVVLAVHVVAQEPENPAEAQRWTWAEAARFLAYVTGDRWA